MTSVSLFTPPHYAKNSICSNDGTTTLSLEEFKRKLKSSVQNKTPEQIARELFRVIPQGIGFHEIVDLIFNECPWYGILPPLDAICIAYPSFSLSPYDKIRRLIVEDEGRLITNHSLMALLKEHDLDSSHEKVQACYDLAYRIKHPHIFKLSQTAILPGEYTLNFLWVNLNPQDRIKNVAQNIFKEGLDLAENAECMKDPVLLRRLENGEESVDNWETVKKSFTYKISRWADVHPGAQIHLWYDSALVTQKAQQKTSEMLRAISESRGVDLRLRDIRQLSNIKGEIGNALHPGTHVYFRVDLLKALIADHMIRPGHEKAKYCVVSDVDVEPMAPEHMFDQRTLNFLSSSGYVFNRLGLFAFENNFFIFNKEKEDLQKIHCETMIEEIAATIKELRRYRIGCCQLLDAQSVFREYYIFRKTMKESDDKLTNPRKVAQAPRSQFNLGGGFPNSDHRAEKFRFIGRSNVPYTLYGRNDHSQDEECQIEELIDWEAEPLSL